MQTDDPGPEKDPIPQGVHVEAPIVLDLPAAQALHEVDAVSSW
tara:strand:- start:3714 stop:3842 length:129 start_codon:yes stop_codon:yes gene_type:complete